MKPEFKQPRANILRAVGLIQRAAQQGAQLIALPELFSTGYSFMSEEDAAPFAEVVGPIRKLRPERSLHVMPALAKKLNVTLVWGFMEKDAVTGRLYNAQALVTPSGKIVTTRKVNRFGSDYMWASVGESNPPIVPLEFNGKTYKVGLLICRDIRDQRGNEKGSFFEPHEADMVVLSAAWGDGGVPANAWIDFVTDNKCWLLVSNRYGYEKPNDFGEGGTCVIAPNLKVHCNGLVWSEDCIVLAEIP